MIRLLDWVWSGVKSVSKNSTSPRSLACLRSSDMLDIDSDLVGVSEADGL